MEISRSLPLFAPDDGDRPIALRRGAVVTVREFRRDVAAIMDTLQPAGPYLINLCEDRYLFLAALAAALSVQHTVLLPPSRADRIVAEVEAAHAGSYRIDDAAAAAALARPDGALSAAAHAPAEHTALIGFTSGSTGEPKKFPKRWDSLHLSTARNMKAIREALEDERSSALSVVATVPPQHMYGMELSVLLPLVGGVAVHSGRPLFPADIAQALAESPRPRLLVTTPVHLRAIVESSHVFPHVDLIISATAPLEQALAIDVEAKLGGRLLEMFGSTETCIFASRFTAREQEWRLFPGVRLTPQTDGALVDAQGFAAPVMLQDLIELTAPDRFIVRGRNSDIVEVAGKRASLGDLTRRLLLIEGVRDAVVFQPEADSSGAVRRLAALVVAPGLTAAHILEQLAPSVDPALAPRPLVLVDQLPRNEVGKLSRAALRDALRRR